MSQSPADAYSHTSQATGANSGILLAHENVEASLNRPAKRKKVDAPPDNRRMSHNSAEKRRRDKINESIEELRTIVPNADDDARKTTNKAAVLKRSVEYLRDLEVMYQRLVQEHHALCAENENLKQLRATVQQYMASQSEGAEGRFEVSSLPAATVSATPSFMPPPRPGGFIPFSQANFFPISQPGLHPDSYAQPQAQAGGEEATPTQLVQLANATTTEMEQHDDAEEARLLQQMLQGEPRKELGSLTEAVVLQGLGDMNLGADPLSRNDRVEER